MLDERLEHLRAQQAEERNRLAIVEAEIKAEHERHAKQIDSLYQRMNDHLLRLDRLSRDIGGLIEGT